MGRHNSLSGGNPRYTTHLVASHRPDEEEDCSKDLSVRNGILLYKQLIHPMMDYACPAWRSVARTHVRRLQALQSKCLRLATSDPRYISNRQIHEDLGFTLFADHIRALTASFDSKLADAEKPLALQLGRNLR
jgi:hypothetical protein